MNPRVADEHGDLLHDRRWTALVVLCMSMLALGIDNTVLNVAVPALSQDLGATTIELQWIITSYMVVFAGLLLPMGSLGDRRGRRRALQIGLAVFGAGSLASSTATSAEMLVVTRSSMGVGAALIMPATLSLLTGIFVDPRERARAIAVWSAVAGIAGAIGPILGGFLVDHGGWRSVFLVNVPIAATAIVAGRRVLPPGRPGDTRAVDPGGAALSIASFGLVVFAVTQAPVSGFGDPVVLATLASGLGLLAAFLLWELRCRDPMFDPRVFRDGRFSGASAAITLVFFAMFGALFLVTQYMQLILGFSPSKAGVGVLPLAVLLVVVAPLSPALVERFGTKAVVCAGLLAVTCGLGLASTVPATNGYPRLALAMAVIAFGTGLVTAPATESIMGSLPPSRTGVGSAMNDATRQMGTALGVAIIGSAFAATYRREVRQRLEASGAPPDVVAASQESVASALDRADTLAGGALARRADIGESFVRGLRDGLRVGALATLLAAALVVAWLPSLPRSRAGRETKAGLTSSGPRD